MANLRAFFMNYRAFAALLVAVAFATKIIIPTGYMIGHGPDGLMLQLCSGVVSAPDHGGHGDAHAHGGHMGGGADMTHGAKMDHAANMHHDGGTHHQGEGDAADQHQCPYTALAMASTAGVDMDLLATSIAFLMVLGLLPLISAPTQRLHYLRPPSRGPPAKA